jgi:hypothetical protein
MALCAESWETHEFRQPEGLNMQSQTIASRLEQDLEAYSVTSKSSAAACWRDRFGSWTIYAAATASALAGSTSASAGIIYSGLLNDSVSLVPNESGVRTQINIHAGPVDAAIRIYHSANSRGLGGFADIGFGYVGQGAVSNVNASHPNFLKRFASGANISGGLGEFHRGIDHDKLIQRAPGGTQDFGFWPLKSNTGFVGVRFVTAGNTRSGSGGGFDYGWLRLSFQTFDGVPDEITLIDYAYNDVANASIQAGQETSATPEPASAAMMLLATGAAGLLAMRRRRKGV